MNAPLKRNASLAAAALLASSGTLVCCVLPAVMVAAGAGATLAGLVTAVPQLVWLSEHKGWVFGFAGMLLAIAGITIWHSRRLPCPTDPRGARTCKRLRRVSAVLYLLALLAFCIGSFFAFLLPRLSREAEVHSRGADVMTFSLDATQHVFEKTDFGGLQRVIAREGHADQVEHIRGHLKMIADWFARSDFSGPAHIHGDKMPGLAELRAASKDELSTTYRDIEQGGEIRYVTRSENIRDAIHRWFDAQLSDHGHDAMEHHHE